MEFAQAAVILKLPRLAAMEAKPGIAELPWLPTNVTWWIVDWDQKIGVIMLRLGTKLTGD